MSFPIQPLQRMWVSVFTFRIAVVADPVTVIGPEGTSLRSVTVYWPELVFLTEPQPATAKPREWQAARVRRSASSIPLIIVTDNPDVHDTGPGE
jgi:hypothetical protein